MDKKITCLRCNSEKNITIIYTDDGPNPICQTCKKLIFNKKKPGRPSEGITKKVSLTLSENEWKLLDQAAKGNRARFLREIVREALMK